MHILKFTDWESPSGWHSNDTSDLANGSGNWWNVPRMLDLELTDYIILLKNKFNAINFHYDVVHNVLLWNWQSYTDCHNFTLYVNNEARKRKFFI